jgi:ESCRT-II complex subunit VPS25
VPKTIQVGAGSVDAAFQRHIAATMVDAGSAMYDTPASKGALPSAIFVLYRRPEAWADAIYLWVGLIFSSRARPTPRQVSEKGLLNSIVTFYELTSGEDPSAPDIQDMPLPLLRLVLAHLAKTGRAQVFKGTEAAGDGVKFF